MLSQFLQALLGTLPVCLLAMGLYEQLNVRSGLTSPPTRRWLRFSLGIGIAVALIFACLRTLAIVDRRTAYNFPLLCAAVIVDIAVIAVAVAAQPLRKAWYRAVEGIDSVGTVSSDANSSDISAVDNTTIADETGAKADGGLSKTQSHKQSVALQQKRMAVAQSIAGVGVSLTAMYALPDVVLQLTNFVEPGDSPFTSQMLVRFIGFTAGIALSVLIALLLRKTLCIVPDLREGNQTSTLLKHTTLTSSETAFSVSVGIVALLTFAYHAAEFVALLINMRFITLSGLAFRMLILVRNHTLTIVILCLVAFALPAIVSFIIGLKLPTNIPNTAIARSYKARKHQAKVSAVWALLIIVATSVTLVWGTKHVNMVPELTPPESYTLNNNVATITFDQVKDGHLHRFEYKAADGTVMRFIIIQKNGGAYGVGLDACETCGDAGYYEKDGKIICKRCDVAINLATIGFKGGCNPIPLPFTVANGTISIQTADLDALSSHFK